MRCARLATALLLAGLLATVGAQGGAAGGALNAGMSCVILSKANRGSASRAGLPSPARWWLTQAAGWRLLRLCIPAGRLYK